MSFEALQMADLDGGGDPLIFYDSNESWPKFLKLHRRGPSWRAFIHSGSLACDLKPRYCGAFQYHLLDHGSF